MGEVTLEIQQSEAVTNNILDRKTKPELAQYLHVALFRPATARLLKEIKQGFLEIWPGLTENLINNDIKKSRNTTMGHLHSIIQGLQLTREKLTDIDLEDKRKQI